jgi:hypothetical protein
MPGKGREPVLIASLEGYLVSQIQSRAMTGGPQDTGGSSVLTEKKMMNMRGAMDREVTAVMMEAFNKACQSLHDWGQPDVITEVVAQRC